jgi:hypothetical protein
VRYETLYCKNADIAHVAAYVDKTLQGVPRERIVSIDYSMAVDSGGTSPHFFHSVLIVLQRADNPKDNADSLKVTQKSG